jgi:hypothetical protein
MPMGNGAVSRETTTVAQFASGQGPDAELVTLGVGQAGKQVVAFDQLRLMGRRGGGEIEVR